MANCADVGLRHRKGEHNYCNLLLIRIVATLIAFAFAAFASAQTLAYKDLYQFGTGVNPSYPSVGVTFDASGNMYGATQYGGIYDPNDEAGGTVWEITDAGTFKVLHNFGGTVTLANGKTGPDGISPMSPIVVDGSGDLFGTAEKKGGGGVGMIWEITAVGAYKDLHDFGGTITDSDGSSGPDGSVPLGALYQNASGDLFGVAAGGGANDNIDSGGMLWELTASGVYTDLHDFGEYLASGYVDGFGPEGGVTADSAGNLFGTTAAGGRYYIDEGDSLDFGGVLWELTPAGVYTDLHDFGGTVLNADGVSGPDGQYLPSSVALDASGDVYGTTFEGGPNLTSNGSAGILWEFTSGGAYRDVHDFGGTITNADGVSGTDGSRPSGLLTFDGLGDLLGTASAGGPYLNGISGGGILWQLTPAGQYGDLHDFGGAVTQSTGTMGTDGVGPGGGVTLDPSGHPCGMCGGFPTNAASEGTGMVWEMLPQRIESVTLSPSTIGGLGAATGTITLAGGSSAGWKVNLKAGASSYLNLPSSVTVPAGLSSAIFTITGTAQRSATLNMGIIATDSANSNVESILTIQGDEVNGLSFSPSAIGGSGSTLATVTLASPAPPGGWIVHPTAAASGYLSMPSTVTVPAGATSTTFTITGTTQRTGTAGMGVVASDGNASVESILTVDGDALASIALSPTTMGWSGTSTGTVTLNSPAPEGGWLVNLKAGASGYLNMPSSVTVPAGATTVTFSITGTSQRTESVTIGVIAHDTSNQVETDLTVTGDALTGVSVNPTSVAPGGSSAGTVTLSSPAPAGGWGVKLWAGAPTDVQVPSTVTVPAGATSATFSISTPANAHPSTYGIFANDGTAQFEAMLTIT